MAIRMFVIIILSIGLSVVNSFNMHAQKLDIQGHRGARGLFPENTIPAFLKALDYGVTTIELDLAVTADSQLVVSHEPYFSSAICLDRLGKEIKSKNEKKHNIFKMTYEEVQEYDCGSKENPDFPEQIKINATKPLLKDVIKEVEQHIRSYTRYEVDYNIEIKSTPAGDNSYHPTPEEYSELVYQLVDQYLPWNRVVIQSFDFRVLRHWNKKYPEVRLAALVETPGPVSATINELGFQPHIFSPNYRLLNKQKVSYLHNLGIKVIPWTVNEAAEMKKLVRMGVDGIITDYPNRAAAVGLIVSKNIESN